jgi:hypothetical protein
LLTSTSGTITGDPGDVASAPAQVATSSSLARACHRRRWSPTAARLRRVDVVDRHPAPSAIAAELLRPMRGAGLAQSSLECSHARRQARELTLTSVTFAVVAHSSTRRLSLWPERGRRDRGPRRPPRCRALLIPARARPSRSALSWSPHRPASAQRVVERVDDDELERSARRRRERGGDHYSRGRSPGVDALATEIAEPSTPEYAGGLARRGWRSRTSPPPQVCGRPLSGRRRRPGCPWPRGPRARSRGRWPGRWPVSWMCAHRTRCWSRQKP